LSTTNYGEFVQPPRQIDVSGLGCRRITSPTTRRSSTWVVRTAPRIAAVPAGVQGTQLALGESTAAWCAGSIWRRARALPHRVQGDAGLTALDATGKPALKAFDADAARYIYLADPTATWCCATDSRMIRSASSSTSVIFSA